VDDATTVRGKLEGALAAYAGQPVGVAIRDRAELARALAANPFADAPPNRCAIVFLNDAPAPDALSRATGRRSERIALGEREIYIDYPDRMGATKLKLPAAAVGTARNLNTVAKLIAIADAMEI
jgi:uncharacterized protein (DUF1697 family)